MVVGGGRVGVSFKLKKKHLWERYGYFLEPHITISNKCNFNQMSIYLCLNYL